MTLLTFNVELIKVLNMYRFVPYLVILTVLFAACMSAPSENEEFQAEEEIPAVTAMTYPEEQQETTEQGVSEPSLSIHEMYYDPVAEADIRQALNNLKDFIIAEDFDNWKNSLTEAYYEEVTSAENFASLNTALQRRRITLTEPEHYFEHVVVPSRTTWAKSQLDDDIEFLSADHVRVYEQHTRHRVYELRRIDNQWKVSR